MSEHLGDVLSGLLDGELSPSAEGSARRHLASCEQCSAHLEDVRTARAWVRALPAAEPPFGFLERLVLDPAVTAGPRAWGSRRVALAALAGSAAAAVGLLGLAPPRDTPVSPSVGRFVEAHATGASLSGDPLSRLAPIGVPITFRR